jgi:hypothetical protein
MEDEELKYYFGGKEVSEKDVSEKFKNEHALSFLYDEEYENWVYITSRRRLRSEDKLMVLIKHKKHLAPYLKTGFFYIYLFETCDPNIAKFAGLPFSAAKEYFSVIGGIRVANYYRLRNDALGAWYDFALPKIKINLGGVKRVFIDSKEIMVNNDFIDLADLTLKEENKKLLFKAREKEYSLKCTAGRDALPPVFFVIKSAVNDDNSFDDSGWKISKCSLRPIKSDEAPDIIGLKFCHSDIDITTDIRGDEELRPFLYKIDKLQNRFSNTSINKKISLLEKRRLYGV